MIHNSRFKYWRYQPLRHHPNRFGIHLRLAYLIRLFKYRNKVCPKLRHTTPSSTPYK